MDNRSTHRSQLLIYLDVLNREDGKHLGYLGDISTSGFMFISQGHWRVGDHISVRIPLEEEQALVLNQLNPEASFSGQDIDGEVEVRWTRPNINNPKFHCFGCVFAQWDESQAPLIAAVAKQLGVDERVLLSRVQ